MTKNESDHVIVLASGSRARAEMLRAAGIAIEIRPARIDEAELKAGLKSEGCDAGRAALALAQWKAAQVAGNAPGRLVLGADQMLECEGAWFDKPADREGAAGQLRLLRGKTHVLHSAAALVQDGRMIWHHVASARMRVRAFSEAFLEDYLRKAGEDTLHCVGAYRLEGEGVQLFDQIEGDYFTVLGLPLLPVIGFLREREILPT